MSHGKDFKIMAPRSKFYQGPFGRICPDLPPWVPEIIDFDGFRNVVNDHKVEEILLEFANERMLENGKDADRPIELADNGDDRDSAGDSNIPAGYTYFGQFIDHDITFDPASSLMRQNDPSGLINHRTPRLDLDNLYGSGPNASPHLYDPEDKFKFAIAQHVSDGFVINDLPRVNTKGQRAGQDAVAVIGDPRNDENIIVSQLHLAFLMAHNRLYATALDQAVLKTPDEVIDEDELNERIEKLGDPAKEEAFNRARRTLRWLYQYLVWNDFLRRITESSLHKKGETSIHSVALALDTSSVAKWELGLKNIYKWKHQPFIPIEFSVAAYRFGHSMVRNSYRTNFNHRGKRTIEKGKNGFEIFVPIFDNSTKSKKQDLRGKRILNLRNTIQWNWFLEMESSQSDFPQMARKIDTKLSNALGFLHEQAIPRAIDEPRQAPLNFLAFRNLLRAHQFALPSGTSFAKKYCVDPIDLDFSIPKDQDVPTDLDSLWYYILKEAGSDKVEVGGSGNRLGKIGSLIVCATFAGLLKGDPNSYLNIQPCWDPKSDDLINGALPKLTQAVQNEVNKREKLKDENGEIFLTLSTIIRLSGLPIKESDMKRN